MDSVQTKKIIRYEGGRPLADNREIIVEEPLAIQVEGKPYSVVMRTPGKEIHHAAGFCLAEGLVDDSRDFAAIGFCEDMDPNVITVSLTPARREKVGELLKRKGFISQSSCGICGKELVKDLFQFIKPVTDKNCITIDNALKCYKLLPELQHLYKRSNAAHAVAIFDSKLNLMTSAEDVGRHNALDKAIGDVFMTGERSNAFLAVLSSRISYEMVQKAARAQLAIVIGSSMPTTLALKLGAAMNMTLACFRKGRFVVFCGEERLEG